MRVLITLACLVTIVSRVETELSKRIEEVSYAWIKFWIVEKFFQVPPGAGDIGRHLWRPCWWRGLREVVGPEPATDEDIRFLFDVFLDTLSEDLFTSWRKAVRLGPRPLEARPTWNPWAEAL